MTKIDIEQIRADREVGTRGPWRVRLDGQKTTIDGDEWWGFAKVHTVVDGAPNLEGYANANRIARVPELEDALIEAVKLLRKAQKDDADFAHDCGINNFLERFK